MEKRVAIVGAGISGLLACKYAAAKGFSPIVFEEQDRVGGLWNHTIESTRLQNARFTFEFSDFPWPPSVEDIFPTSSQVADYLQSYAVNFRLLTYMKFNSKVISIDYVGGSDDGSSELWGGTGKAFGSKGKWILKVLHTKDDITKEYEAEFMILCIGRFSGVPNIPKFPEGFGPEIFSGQVLHIMDYSAMENADAANFIKGKRVAIIGSGKSATDTALEIANANGTDTPCTVIQRTAHWALPDFFPWGVNFGYFCATRFSELTVHKPGEGLSYSVLATLLKPMRWAMSKFVESYIRWKLPLKKYGMVPKESFLNETASCQIFLLPETYYDKVENGSIILKISQNFTFCKQGLIIDEEDDPLKVDIVIFATGYKGDEKLKNIFASPSFQNYIFGSPNSPIPLYRQIIHPRIPQLAAIGYSETTSNLYTFEMRCKWVAWFLDGAFDLPRIKVMEKEIETWEKYMKRYAGNACRRACVAALHIWYNDQLCKDIRCNPRRKKGFFSELFQPYGLPDYNGIAPGAH